MTVTERLAYPCRMGLDRLHPAVACWFSAASRIGVACSSLGPDPRKASRVSSSRHRSAASLWADLQSAPVDDDPVPARPKPVDATTVADRVRVEVSGEVVSLVPFLDLRVVAVEEGPIERFIPQPDR